MLCPALRGTVFRTEQVINFIQQRTCSGAAFRLLLTAKDVRVCDLCDG